MPNGTHTLVFTIYDAAAGGTVIESISVPGVETVEGRFSAPVPVTPGSFNASDRWWTVTYAGTEMLPRQKVTATPYAMVATQLRYGDTSGSQIIPVTGNLVSSGGLAMNRERSPLALLDAFQSSSSTGAAVARFLHGNSGADPTVWINYRHSSTPSTFDMLRCDSGASTEFVVQHVNGEAPIRVAIGLPTPQLSRLHVHQPFNSNFSSARFGATTVGNDLATVWLNFMNSDGTLDLIRANVAGPDEALRVRADGRTEVLDLSCRMLTIRGADLAEKFDVAAPVAASASMATRPAPGMVVSIDPTNPGKPMVATTAYDRKVAGVISGANGLDAGVILGQGNPSPSIDGEHPVAMTGRVWVFADPSAGVIEPGDRLTTSGARPGHAMKVTNEARAPGAVIGKAMTGTDPESGMVLVLVNLQ